MKSLFRVLIHPRANQKEMFLHCSIHTVVSAAPSFLIALEMGYRTLPAILGMCFGVLLFIFCAYGIHSLSPLRKIFTGEVARFPVALVKGLRLVTASIATVNLILLERAMEERVLGEYLIGADVIAGIAAYRLLDPVKDMIIFDPPSNSTWFGTFLLTFTEGLVLASFMGLCFLLLYVPLKALRLLIGRSSLNPS